MSNSTADHDEENDENDWPKYLDPFFSTEIPDRICDGVYLGSRNAARNQSELMKMNVTHILCVADFTMAYPNVFKVKRIQIDDFDNVPIINYFEEGIQFIQDALQSGASILVHCAAGVSRSATMVIAYIMKKEKMLTEQALALVRSKRSIVYPNDGFLFQLHQFEAMNYVVDTSSDLYKQTLVDISKRSVWD